MNNDEIQLTHSQERAFKMMISFIENPDQRIFILKGYAGTGKTTLMKCLVCEFDRLSKRVRLLASTGRAAKILSNTTGMEAHTIHSQVYTFNGLNQDLDKLTEEQGKTGLADGAQLLLDFTMTEAEDDEEIVFLIDESSMVSDQEQKIVTQARFGSGRVLKDLIDCYPAGKFIFVGDPCQLPPITQPFSPALSVDYFRQTFDEEPPCAELTEIMRQQKGNDLIQSAQRIRQLFANPPQIKWAKFPLRGYHNIHILSSQADLLSLYIEDIKKNGFNSATLLGFTNKQCNDLTRLIRPSLGIFSQTISVGDLLLVTQNNYISGLMNGDLVVVKAIGAIEQRAGLHFQTVSVEELFSKKVYEQLLVLEVLYANETNLTQEQQRELMLEFYFRMKDKGIKQKSKAFNQMMMQDPYLNALRAVYGFVLTCHKAQGGEWDRVYLDIPRSFPSQAKPYVYQWMYTAMTRAKEDLYVVNDFWIM